MRMRRHVVGGFAAAGVLAASVVGAAGGQAPAGGREIAAAAAAGASMRRTENLVRALVRNDELVLASRTPDRYLPARVHENFLQYHGGVPVQGGGMSRQRDGGLTVSIFGTLHEEIDVDPAPRLSAAEARALVERQTGAGPAANEPPSLVVVPTLAGAYVLAWRMPMDDRRTYYLDAHRGRIAHYESNVFEQQASVGEGAGIQGQRKKLSTSESGGRYLAHDRLRPAEIVTLDMRYDRERETFLNTNPAAFWEPGDVASDDDGAWGDRAVVDAHAHAGLAYDYFATRHGWNGMDGRNGRMIGMVNIGRGFANAFFAPPPFGPEGTGVAAFGELGAGRPIVPADIVAHEIMHGITFFSVSARTGRGLGNTVRAFPGPAEFTLPDGLTVDCEFRWTYRDAPGVWPSIAGRTIRFACDDEGRLLLHADHGGAVNEAYSDVFGTAVEFMAHEPAVGPLRADYVMGEDVEAVGRSLEDPGSFRLGAGIPYPDAFSRMVWFLVEEFEDGGWPPFVFSDIGTVDGGRTLVRLPSYDYTGVHWNSTILSHAFYLAVEGGRNRTTGLAVAGVGGANRLDVERAFFRAMTVLMPNSTSMGQTAALVRQSAVDLFGHGSRTHRAVEEAFRAVGLPARPAM